MKLFFKNKFLNNIKVGSYISLFLILFLSSSFLIIQDILSSFITAALWIFVLLVLLFPKFRIDKNHFFFLAIIVVLIWISALLNHEDLINYAKITFGILCSFLFVEKYSLHIFKKTFVNVLVFLSAISLLFFLVALLVPSFRNLTFITNGKTTRMSNLVFYTIDKQEYYRNFGMFWEPGAFQTFLGISILLELSTPKASIRKIMILLIAMVTTMSTTAFISIALILLFIVFSKKNKNKKLRHIAILMCLSGIVLFFAFESFLFSGVNSTFGKIIYFIDSDAEVSNHTTSVRYWAIVKSVEAFVISPFYGMGYAGLNEYAYEYTFGMNTCTFLNWFSVYGLVYGLIAFFSTYSFISQLYKNPLRKFFAIIILFLLIISENYVNNAVYFLIIFYGGCNFFKQYQMVTSNENYRTELIK